jgi:cysteinyl-tRNA synthetase
MHNDYLIVNGEKMSKSLGNFFTIRDLLDKGWTGPELRWVLLGTHYRKKLNFTFDSCNQARTAMKKFKEFFQRLKAVDSAGEASEATVKQVNESKQAFAEALGDDLNISKAIAATYSLMHYGNGILDQGTVNKAEAELLLEQFRDFDRVMMLFDVDSAAEEEQVPAEILELAQKRQDARKNKDFAAADAIRDQLKEAGWVIEDTAEGPKVKRI